MATLKSLVDETTNIKNELVECHATLKNKLTEKGIECNNTDKILALINKVKNIQVSKKVIASENVLSGATRTGTGIQVSGKTYVVVGKFYIGLSGSIRVTASVSSPNSNVTGYMKFNLVRDGNIQYSSTEFSAKATQVYCTYDFEDVRNGDIVEIQLKTSSTSYYANAYDMAICGDVY